MARSTRRKKAVTVPSESGALFMGTGVRGIARKTMLPGYTVSDIEQFLTLLYGMFDDQEAKRITVYDPFASDKARRVTVARLADALASLVDIQADMLKKSA